MKKFHIAAYNRTYGVIKVFSEEIEAPSEKDARIGNSIGAIGDPGSLTFMRSNKAVYFSDNSVIF